MSEDKELERMREAWPDHLVARLPDESFAMMGMTMTTMGVFLGVTPHGYERRYCYRDIERAVQEFQGLRSEDDEPTGWVARRPERPEDIAAKARPGYEGGVPSFKCPRCAMVSFNPYDVINAWCGKCKAQTA